MPRIVILTGSELRHTFFRTYLASLTGIDVVHSFCEGAEKSLRVSVEKSEGVKNLRMMHVSAREQSEKDFFGVFVDKVDDRSHPTSLPKSDINLPHYAQMIIKAKPDLIVAYGCSIIREPLLSAFPGRFINVHLGLSPYYRGSGTNFWPLVNGEPEYVGVTFMHIDAGIDTGEILHQIRARYSWGDTPSQIGNRLIMDMTQVCGQMITCFPTLAKMTQLPKPIQEKVYKKKDYTEESVEILYKKMKEGLIDEYLHHQAEKCAQVPILSNPVLTQYL